MTKRLFTVTLVVAAMLIAGVVTASNMGFKLNYSLSLTGTNTGTNTISLPYNRQAGINTAGDLITDIGLANVANMQDWDPATDSFSVYTARKGSPDPDFNLDAGSGNFIVMTADVNYIIVGSHDPSLSVNLQDSSVTLSGTNMFGYPYHSTAANSTDLINDIGLANVANVQNWDPATDSWAVHTGRKGSPDPQFNLDPGKAYFIVMTTTTTYTPSHY